MRKADAYIQAGLLGICLLTSINIIIPMLILIGIGVYQVIAQIVALVNMSETRKQDQTLLRIYWFSVIGYWLVVLGVYLSGYDEEDFWIFWLAILPWAYAVYCTTITFIRAYNNGEGTVSKRKHHQHNEFLDNIDFE